MFEPTQLSDVFLKGIRQFIVSIYGRDAQCDTDPKLVGTGIIVVRLRHNETGETTLGVATAGHVLQHEEDQAIEWTIRREIGSETRTVRVITSKDSPLRAVWYNGEWYRKPGHSGPELPLDIGVVGCNNITEKGTQFLGQDEVLPDTMAFPMLADTSTRVAWAGYPSDVAQAIGAPQLCYYEGNVSTVVNRAGWPALYLLDGHNSPGTSGSPVWAWNDATNKHEIIAIVTHYKHPLRDTTSARFPGLVIATPIDHLMKQIREWHAPR